MLDNDKTYIVLLVKNVQKIFCYFNISNKSIEDFEKKYGSSSWGNALPLLKVYYIVNGTPALRDTIPLDPFANNWFIDMHEDDKDVYVEYGRVVSGGEFVSMAVSNMVTTPRNHQSGDSNLYFVDIDIDEAKYKSSDEDPTEKKK